MRARLHYHGLNGLEPCRLPEQQARSLAAIVVYSGAPQTIETVDVVVPKLSDDVSSPRNFEAGLFRPPQHPKPLAAEINHLRHERDAIQSFIVTECREDLAEVFYAHPIVRF